MEALLIALVAAIPATIAALAAWRSSNRTRRQTTTGNGHTIAETVEDTSKRIERLATEDKVRSSVILEELAKHLIADELSFAMIKTELAHIRSTNSE